MIKYYIPGIEKLVIVSTVCAVCYFLFKKIVKKEGIQRSDIRIVSVMPLGQKEKLVVCEIQNKKFIMGVTQHSISHLHTFDNDVVHMVEEEPAKMPKKHYTPYFT